MSEPSSQYSAMAKSASWTLVSRILGLIRDQLTAGIFGASPIASAFILAFSIPNLFRRLLGEGALTAATIPALAQKSVKDGKLAAFGFLNFVISKILPWTIGLTLVSIVGLLLYAFAVEENRPALLLTALCMPYMPIICIAALFTAAVNLSGRFGLAEIAAAFLNLSMIFALCVCGEYFASTEMGRAVWLCIGALFGGILQLLIPLWGLKRQGWTPKLFQPDLAAWKVLSIAFLPAALGAGIHQLNVLISRTIAYEISDASLMFYFIANRIVELPIGLFSVSVAVVIFPALAKAYANRDAAAMSTNYGRGMRLVLAINIGAAFGLAALAEPIVKLLFEFGRFNKENCENTSKILVLFAFAMPFYAMISIATRALNVIGHTQATFVAALHALIVNVIGSIVVLSFGFGVEGLAVANGISTIWQYIIIRNRLRMLSPETVCVSLLKPTFQVLLGSLILGIIAFQGYAILHTNLTDYLSEKCNLFISMSLSAIVSMTFYAIYLDRLGYPERDLLRSYLTKVLRLFKTNA